MSVQSPTSSPSGSPARINVLGVGINAADMPEALDIVDRAADTPKLIGYVTFTGVHGVIESQSDDWLKRIHNRSFLSLPDGIPLVWMGWWDGHSHMRQVCGPEFMPALLARGLEKGRRHFFWGGGQNAVEALVLSLRQRHPQLRIVGQATPPFRPLNEREERELAEEIREARPHYFWVGLSTPKQERFMAGFLDRHSETLRSPAQGLLMLGVGAAFDFQAGLAKEAPGWLRGSGFEWFYRMCMEPKRLWRRYLRNNPRFVYGVIRQKTGTGRFPMLGIEDS